LPFITSFNSQYIKKPKLVTILLELWDDKILTNADFKKTFGNNTPQLIYKRGNTLQKLLVHAKYVKLTSQFDTLDIDLINTLANLLAENDSTVTKCNTPNCLCCQAILTTSTFQSSITKIQYPITHTMTCDSNNIIYLITCTKCYKQYVGQTSRKLRMRLNGHRSDIKLNKNTTISIHFNSPLHTINNLKITPMEQIDSTDTSELLRREQFWMNALYTKYPNGLNYYPLLYN